MTTNDGPAGPSLPWLARPRARSWTCGIPEHVRSGEVRAFHASLPGYTPSPLTEVPALAGELGVGRAFVKDESSRLGLPAFKVLGASWAIHQLLTGSPANEPAPPSEPVIPAPPDALATLRAAAQRRRVSVRLSHPAPGPSAEARDWPLRASDFDTAGHVSNTVHWQAAEEILAGLDWLPARAEMEYHRPILPGCRLRLVCRLSPGHADLWLNNDAARLASAQLSR